MIALELFPCSGGMAEGFRRAGVVFDFAFDHDVNACASYEHNLGHRPIQMDVRDLLRMVRAGWRPAAQIDLLVADPPCTPWSRAGKRAGRDDDRDMLDDTAELIALLRPRAYLIGNVPGLQDSTSWHVVQEVIGGLARHGYCVRDYASLDAADYGIPQRRVRPFWFGHLDGPCIRWPAPTHGDVAGQSALPGLALVPWVTCRQALGHLPPEQLGRPVRMKIREPGEFSNGGDRSICSRPDEPARVVLAHQTAKGGQILLTGNAKHPVNTLDAPSYTVTAKGDGRGAQGACVLRLEDPNRPPAAPDQPHRAVTGVRDQALLEWPWDRPCTTVQGDERVSLPGHHDAKVGNSQHGPNAIVLSELAAAILQGFPETWLFSGATKAARWSQIGQAMPPGLAAPVAMAVVEQMRSAAREAA